MVMWQMGQAVPIACWSRRARRRWCWYPYPRRLEDESLVAYPCLMIAIKEGALVAPENAGSSPREVTAR